MKKTTSHLFCIILLLGFVATPLNAQIPHLIFHAELGGEELVPPVSTEGKGLVTLLFTPDRTKVTVSGMLVRLEGTITAARIRIGKPGQTGPILLDLMPIIASSSRQIKGQLDVPPQLLRNLLSDGVFAEVLTTAHATGEIRGQFVCETDLDYGISMSGDQVVPATTSEAIGFGGLHFPLGSEDVTCAFSVRGLSGPITAIGIYEGQPGENGALVETVPPPPIPSSLVQSLIILDTVVSDFLRKAREGKYYISVATANFPNGEIRGQIRHMGYFGSLAPVNGVQQVPMVITPGFAFNHTRISPGLDSLSTTVFVNNITPTSVKIHIGAAGQVGPELVTMDPQPVSGFYSKKYPITEQQLTDFAEGRLYINVTTASHPDGEIRGFLKNTLRKGYAFDLCGPQVIPPNSSLAYGVAVASVDQANCYFNYKVITDGLSGAPTLAYVAQGAFGSGGTALFDIPKAEPLIPGQEEIMLALGPIIENSGTYVEICTPDYPNGEIRGQIRRGLTCPDYLGLSILDRLEKVAISPVPFNDYLNIELASPEAFEGRLLVHDVMGIQTLVQNVRVEAGAQVFHLNTAHLPAGTYAVSLEIPGEDASRLLKKVVKAQ